MSLRSASALSVCSRERLRTRKVGAATVEERRAIDPQLVELEQFLPKPVKMGIAPIMTLSTTVAFWGNDVSTGTAELDRLLGKDGTTHS